MSLFANYILDWFTFYHFLLWAGVGALLFRRCGTPFTLALVTGLVCGVVWEVAEIYVEVWLGFREPFWNRWVTDPVADALGTAAGWWTASRLWSVRYGIGQKQ